MPDREKVIDALEKCAAAKCDDRCPYSEIQYGCRPKLMLDATAMLKEQEPIEPTFKQDEKGIFVWCCGSCGAYMYHIYDGIDKAKEYAKYCRQCGKPVLWEGR